MALLGGDWEHKQHFEMVNWSHYVALLYEFACIFRLVLESVVCSSTSLNIYHPLKLRENTDYYITVRLYRALTPNTSHRRKATRAKLKITLVFSKMSQSRQRHSRYLFTNFKSSLTCSARAVLREPQRCASRGRQLGTRIFIVILLLVVNSSACTRDVSAFLFYLFLKSNTHRI